jgi:hypothetical protein
MRPGMTPSDITPRPPGRNGFAQPAQVCAIAAGAVPTTHAATATAMIDGVFMIRPL